MKLEHVDINHTRRKVESMTEEAIKAIFAQIKPQDVVIDGMPAKIKIFYPPKCREDDGWSFGVDVACANGGWHLEFCMKKTGWGGSPVAKIMEVQK